MPKTLFDVTIPDKAIQLLKSHLNLELLHQKNREKIKIIDALDRVLSQNISTDINLPGFNRSTMDGYAIKAEDSFGASDSLPAYLKIVGEIDMGCKPEFKLNVGEAVKISTGGMLPVGSNAVVMLEYSEQIDEKNIEIRKSVAPWENVVRKDEDLTAGKTILKKGHKIRPQDIGILAGIGRLKIEVYKKPRIAIISTGNEIVPANEVPDFGQVRDINSYTLGACLLEMHAIPIYKGIVKDEKLILEKKIKETIQKKEADAIIISGGSSVGSRDITLEVLSRLGKPGILVHGVSVKPGKPTIIAVVDDMPIFGLPGHPVSAMIIFDLFLKPLLRWFEGSNDELIYNKQIKAEIDANISSDSGREEYIRVALYKKAGKFFAKPILGKSGLISNMVLASGLVKIDLNVEGLVKGTNVKVNLF